MKKLLILGLFTVFIILILFKQKNLSDLRSRAQDLPYDCQDKCTGQDRCGNGPPGDPNYNDPCCEEVKNTGDPFACPIPQRQYCTADQCSTIPEDVNRQRCGASRWQWCQICKENHCPGYVTNPTQPPQSTPTRQPTQTPRPTQPLPTNTPPIPTLTNTPPLYPTSPPNPTIPPSTPTPTPKDFSLPTSRPKTVFETPQTQYPGFNLPQINLNLSETFNNIVQPALTGLNTAATAVNQNAPRGLDFFEYVFERVTYYDRKLENGINEKISNLLNPNDKIQNPNQIPSSKSQ